MFSKTLVVAIMAFLTSQSIANPLPDILATEVRDVAAATPSTGVISIYPKTNLQGTPIVIRTVQNSPIFCSIWGSLGQPDITIKSYSGRNATCAVYPQADCNGDFVILNQKDNSLNVKPKSFFCAFDTT